MAGKSRAMIKNACCSCYPEEFGFGSFKQEQMINSQLVLGFSGPPVIRAVSANTLQALSFRAMLQ